MTTMATPEAEVEIDDALVRALLAEQHPDLALLPLGQRAEGWDNVTYRLGPALAVRLPRRELAARIAGTELDWLPIIGANWTFPAPVARRVGQPGQGYPWRWAVVPWIHGEVAFDAPFSVEGARDLGRALAQVHQSAPDDAPVNPFRSTSLSERTEIFTTRLQLVERDSDIVAEPLRAIFHSALGTPAAPRTWTHLDLHGENVLTAGGRLAGILDWGDAAVGSPATDLGQAAVLVGRSNVAPMVEAYAGSATVEAASFIASSAGRKHVRAEALHYAVTLAAMEDPRYRKPGLKALRDATRRSGGSVG
ncbi:phosphotransferase [Demequina flava]|uniref:phosphotransferase n=1 Tax=Demequina flava TaxID=1095025 RepID=UPI000A4CEEC4|nr:phosphotransferase [Demequina flava]